MTCSLCNQTLDDPHDPTVATTEGERVHIACADRSARAAYRARTIRAMVTGMVEIGVWALGIEGGVLSAEGWGLSAEGWVLRAMMFVVLMAAHVLINRRWWRYQVQVVRRWTRGLRIEGRGR